PHAFLSGFVYTGLGKYERAVEEAQKVIELDPHAGIGYANLADDYLYLDRLTQAEEALLRAAEHKVEMPDFSALKYDIDFLKSDNVAMAREVTLARSDSATEDWMAYHEAFVLAYAGRMRAARKMSSRASELTKQAGHRERAALFETAAALRE